jgi:hypothetical protein
MRRVGDGDDKEEAAPCSIRLHGGGGGGAGAVTMWRWILDDLSSGG